MSQSVVSTPTVLLYRTRKMNYPAQFQVLVVYLRRAIDCRYFVSIQNSKEDFLSIVHITSCSGKCVPGIRPGSHVWTKGGGGVYLAELTTLSELDAVKQAVGKSHSLSAHVTGFKKILNWKI